MNEAFQIDIDRILAEKAGKKARFVPRFLVSYLKRIVHQDEVNGFLMTNKDKNGIEFLNAFMEGFNNSLDVHGLDNLPAEGRFTFVSNHPLGAQDGIGLAYLLGPIYEGKRE